MGRWLFQRFEERVGCADRHAVGVIDQADFSLTDERTVHDLMFDIADLLNLNLPGGLFRVRLDDEKVRMCVGLDLLAGSAGTATVEPFHLGRSFAVERLCEANGRQPFPDRVLAMEQIGVRQSLMGDGGLQKGDGLLMADTVAKGHVSSGVKQGVVERSNLPRSR